MLAPHPIQGKEKQLEKIQKDTVKQEVSHDDVADVFSNVSLDIPAIEVKKDMGI